MRPETHGRRLLRCGDRGSPFVEGAAEHLEGDLGEFRVRAVQQGAPRTAPFHVFVEEGEAVDTQQFGDARSRDLARHAGDDPRHKARRTLPRPFGTFSVVGADLTRDGRAEVLVAGGDVAVLIGGDGPVLHRIEVEGSPYGLAIHSWLP